MGHLLFYLHLPQLRVITCIVEGYVNDALLLTADILKQCPFWDTFFSIIALKLLHFPIHSPYIQTKTHWSFENPPSNRTFPKYSKPKYPPCA